MNIIWEQPGGALAVTSIFDGSEPVEYADMLRQRGDIPDDWKLLATGVEDFPQDGSQQEDWRFVDGRIVADEACKKVRAKAALMAQIDQLEHESMLNRGSREMQLFQMQEKAAQVAAERGVPAAQVLATNVYYVKLKALDDAIGALRDKLL